MRSMGVRHGARGDRAVRGLRPHADQRRRPLRAGTRSGIAAAACRSRAPAASTTRNGWRAGEASRDVRGSLVLDRPGRWRRVLRDVDGCLRAFSDLERT